MEFRRMSSTGHFSDDSPERDRDNSLTKSTISVPATPVRNHIQRLKKLPRNLPTIQENHDDVRQSNNYTNLGKDLLG